MSFAWTNDRLLLLRQLWPTGMYGRDIAKQLGTTKSAVMGKAGRIGLPGRTDATAGRMPPPPPQLQPGRTKPVGNPAGFNGEPMDGGLTLFALGLKSIGPCSGCGVPLVSRTREHGQACTLCRMTKPGVGAGLYAGRAA